MNRETEFVKALRDSKLKEQGWDLFIPYVQAVLETGIFTSKLCKEAYNFCGIKGAYRGESLEIPTYEFENGKRVDIVDKFRKYPDFDTALLDYVNKIADMYPGAYRERNNYKCYYEGLIHGGREDWMQWSTSPVYSEVLIKLYDKLKTQNEGDLYEVVCG